MCVLCKTTGVQTPSTVFVHSARPGQSVVGMRSAQQPASLDAVASSIRCGLALQRHKGCRHLARRQAGFQAWEWNQLPLAVGSLPPPLAARCPTASTLGVCLFILRLLHRVADARSCMFLQVEASDAKGAIRAACHEGRYPPPHPSPWIFWYQPRSTHASTARSQPPHPANNTTRRHVSPERAAAHHHRVPRVPGAPPGPPAAGWRQPAAPADQDGRCVASEVRSGSSRAPPPVPPVPPVPSLPPRSAGDGRSHPLFTPLLALLPFVVVEKDDAFEVRLQCLLASCFKLPLLPPPLLPPPSTACKPVHVPLRRWQSSLPR